MKKLSIIFLVLALALACSSVFADELEHKTPPVDDGIAVWGYTGCEYSNVEMDRKVYTPDTNPAGQSALLNVEALAYIPCYLRLSVNGNDGKTVLESFGPSQNGTNYAQAVANADGYKIIFDNELGGFVGKNWDFLGRGRNAEVAPGPDTYIQACDIFHVNVFSNDDFKYDVISQPLVGPGNNKLNLEMGTSTTINGTYDSQVFDQYKDITIGQGAACKTLEYYHRFRVPYSTTTVHGGYSGTVTFKAYTI